jgi:flavin reductase (DIM6/NTAB) family NADH-FMN oxidoreductase RutF
MTILAGHIARTQPAPTARPIEADLFRSLLRRQAAPVVMVSAPGEPPAGFTATSFTAVAVHQPLVSFCVDRQSLSWPAVAVARHVGIHLLGADQEDVARDFALRGIDGFARHRWQSGPHGVPLLETALARLVCRIVERVPVGDHALILAEPLHGDFDAEGSAPLLYHMSRYTSAR